MIRKAVTLTALSVFAVLSAAPADAGRFGDRLRDKGREAVQKHAVKKESVSKKLSAVREKLADRAGKAAVRLSEMSEKLQEVADKLTPHPDADEGIGPDAAPEDAAMEDGDGQDLD